MDRVRVLVERGPHAKVPADVFDYELPVLGEMFTIHGELSREAVKPDKDFDIEGEYKRLENKYKQEDAKEAFKSVYPNAASFAQALAPKAKQPVRAAA